MNKKCVYCNKEYAVSSEIIEAYDRFSPVINSIKYNLPLPDLCPDCYEQRRLSFRNKRNLYKRKCDATKKEMISLYSPDKNYKVYNKDYWWSDKWNALDYAMVFDENKGFFEQLDELVHNVPFPNLSVVNSENAEYNDGLVNSKNAYMCFGNQNIEDTYYTEESRLVKDSSDIWWSSKIEKSYECVDNDSLYNSKYCHNGSNSANCVFCTRCNNCNDCFMCYGLEGKKYHILNKPYSKEEYIEKMKDIDLGDYFKVIMYQKIFHDFVLTLPHENMHTYAAENCVGDYVYNSKNCNNCFNVVGAEDCHNLYEGGRCSNVYDSSFIYDLEGPVIGSINVFLNSKNVYFSEYIYDNSFNIYYSFNLKSCKNCFACVGLVGKEYCIFNRQYKMTDYFVEVERIIKNLTSPRPSPTGEGEEKGIEWGEFFPAKLSRFGYNETEANEYYPLTPPLITPLKVEGNSKMFSFSPFSSEGKGSGIGVFNWSLYEAPFPKVDKIIPSSKLPDNIKDIPDDILNRAIRCQESDKPFKIIPEELKFYRENHIPIPRFHYDIRYKHRLQSKNKRLVYDRKCDKCKKEIKTTYAPDRKEIVYCEECYNKEIY